MTGREAHPQRLQSDHISRSRLLRQDFNRNRLACPARIFPRSGRRTQDAVVVVDGRDRRGSRSSSNRRRLKPRDCRFLPFVNVVKDRSDVNVVNMDPVFHDIQAYETSHLGPRVLVQYSVAHESAPQTRGRIRHPRTFGRSADEGSDSYDERPPDFCHAMRIPCLYGKLGIGCR